MYRSRMVTGQYTRHRLVEQKRDRRRDLRRSLAAQVFISCDHLAKDRFTGLIVRNRNRCREQGYLELSRDSRAIFAGTTTRIILGVRFRSSCEFRQARHSRQVQTAKLPGNLAIWPMATMDLSIRRPNGATLCQPKATPWEHNARKMSGPTAQS